MKSFKKMLMLVMIPAVSGLFFVACGTTNESNAAFNAESALLVKSYAAVIEDAPTAEEDFDRFCDKIGAGNCNRSGKGCSRNNFTLTQEERDAYINEYRLFHEEHGIAVCNAEEHLSAEEFSKLLDYRCINGGEYCGAKEGNCQGYNGHRHKPHHR